LIFPRSVPLPSAARTKLVEFLVAINATCFVTHQKTEEKKSTLLLRSFQALGIMESNYSLEKLIAMV
jgi:hypothetical protein